MNSHAQWRLDLAREICEQLRTEPGIQAIFVGGSVARGYADVYSDLEIPLFWDTLPSDEKRLSIAAGLGAGFLYPYNGPAREDNLLVHGFQVDFWHITVSHAQQTIERVLNELSLDAGDSNFMDTLRFCIPLYGAERIEEWKAKAQVYPDALAARQIEQTLHDLQATHLAILSRRDNPTLFYYQISDIQQKLFLILLALNRRYFPTFKWMYSILSEMAIKPEEIEDRFRQAYTRPAQEVVDDTVRIVEETLGLVTEQFPGLDTSRVRYQLRITRKEQPKAIRLK